MPLKTKSKPAPRCSYILCKDLPLILFAYRDEERWYCERHGLEWIAALERKEARG